MVGDVGLLELGTEDLLQGVTYPNTNAGKRNQLQVLIIGIDGIHS